MDKHLYTYMNDMFIVCQPEWKWLFFVASE